MDFDEIRGASKEELERLKKAKKKKKAKKCRSNQKPKSKK